RIIVLTGALLLAIANETNQARSHREADTSFGLVALLGRWCIGGMIAMTAVRDVIDFGAASRALADHGVPAAQFVLALDAGLRLVAGWALIIGFWTRLAALVLIALAVISYNPLVLLYYAYASGAARDLVPLHLALGLFGGLIFAFVLEADRRVVRNPLRANA